MKKLLCVAFAAFALAGCQTTAESNSTPVGVDVAECPVELNVSGEFHEHKSCKRYVMSDNKSYYHYASWAAPEGQAEVFFQRIGGFGYWKNDVTSVSVDDVKAWPFLRKYSDQNGVKEVACQNYDCFSVSLENQYDMTCLWFKRKAVRGNRNNDIKQATNLFEGYACETGKTTPYSSLEAQKLVSYFKVHD